jgi:hypothetical protein
MLTVDLRCIGCATDRVFEQPPCHERHEPDCPEWICTGCDTAVLVEPPAVRVRRPVRAATGTTRRAA